MALNPSKSNPARASGSGTHQNSEMLDDPMEEAEPQAEEDSFFDEAGFFTPGIGPHTEGQDSLVMESDKETSSSEKKSEERVMERNDSSQTQHAKESDATTSQETENQSEDPLEVIRVGRIRTQVPINNEMVDLVAGESGHDYPLKISQDTRWTKGKAIRLYLTDSGGQKYRVGQICGDLGRTLASMSSKEAASFEMHIDEAPRSKQELKSQFKLKTAAMERM